jgi:hypothetical protein
LAIRSTAIRGSIVTVRTARSFPSALSRRHRQLTGSAAIDAGTLFGAGRVNAAQSSSSARSFDVPTPAADRRQGRCDTRDQNPRRPRAGRWRGRDIWNEQPRRAAKVS